MAQYRPQEELGELFTDVQEGAVFTDSKTFVDAIPRYPVKEILKKYRERQDDSNFDLAAFVNENFIIPSQPSLNESDTFPPIVEHIEELWGELVRVDTPSAGSLIELPHPYIVPGGRFNEMYYWDSYFTMLGLQVSGRNTLIRQMVENFAWLIKEYGFIPNGTRTYYLSRSQPPFFSLMVGLLAEVEGDSVYTEFLPHLLQEYRFWMEGTHELGPQQKAFKRVVLLENGSVLNRYWDNKDIPRPEAYKEDVATAELANQQPSLTYRNLRAAAESGWDFSSRWLGNGLTLSSIQTTDIIPVDLNSLLYQLELTIAKAYALQENDEKSKEFVVYAVNRKNALLEYCWSPEADFFMDYNFTSRQPTGVYSLAGMYPLFFELAQEQQAMKVAGIIEEYFLYPGGLPSTLTLTGQQWDAPNGWAPLQWISYVGLLNYGYTDLAETIKERWLETVENEYQESGKLLEKYNVIYPEVAGGGGEYPTQDGFGWTNGVYLQMVKDQP
ncbi:alpha,alpha-trehalase TreF [Nafulsella turpanensis]|uniref:alpha,alpha-trehalase TreF n=1 Tax=Nafulsella turpanensis TaxID=1265690 RepID=UPI000346C038|nr:alpha,alpha-trehalase TreF [Nafulsella turpanensis]